MVVAEFVHLSERIVQHDILPKEKADDVLTEWTVRLNQPQIGLFLVFVRRLYSDV